MACALPSNLRQQIPIRVDKYFMSGDGASMFGDLLSLNSSAAGQIIVLE